MTTPIMTAETETIPDSDETLNRPQAYKRIIALMDDLRSKAPFGYHEPGDRAPYFRMLILHSADIERLLDALLDAATVTERAERRFSDAILAERERIAGRIMVCAEIYGNSTGLRNAGAASALRQLAFDLGATP